MCTSLLYICIYRGRESKKGYNIAVHDIMYVYNTIIYIFVYIYTYICMYIYVYVCIYIYINKGYNMVIHDIMCVCVCVCVCLYLYIFFLKFAIW
jgi:hypothetical protein